MADGLGDGLALLLSDGGALLLRLEVGHLTWDLSALLPGHVATLLAWHLRAELVLHGGALLAGHGHAEVLEPVEALLLGHLGGDRLLHRLALLPGDRLALLASYSPALLPRK